MPARGTPPHRPRGGKIALGLAVTLGTLALVSLLLSSLPLPTPALASSVLAPSALPADPAPSVTTGGGTLSLGISVTPGIICVSNNLACPSDQRSARVTLQAVAPALVTTYYPAVQVVFLLETTAYDGTYDGSLGVPGREYCADSSAHQPCEESNGVPFFVANAGTIASAIANANPRSAVTFGLVNFFSTGDAYDKFSADGAQGLESVAYHVDVGIPVPPSQFQSQVAATFQSEVLNGGWVYPDLNFGNNFLHSDSITALYGVLLGYGISWLPNAHHVLVLIGSTAPRDPPYVQNYCISPSAAWRYACYGAGGPYSAGCEPAYDFGVGVSPQCVGWTASQTGDVNNSIAGLAHSIPNCADSLGKRCTIDVVDLWTTPTDPFSLGWPGTVDGGPGGPLVAQNVGRVLSAGCDLAAATGGSWDGPSFFSCADGTIGDLSYVPHGSATAPDISNPSLLSAFKGVSFGPLTSDVIATGGNSSIFRFVPFANVRPAPNLAAQTLCLTPYGTRNDCPGPTYKNGTDFESLNWNWSSVPSQNILYGGDEWIASFNVVAVGPPYGSVPVDACITSVCAAGGSGWVDGTFTLARYYPGISLSEVNQSFPLAVLRIVYGPQATIPGGTVPAPTGVPPPPPSAVVPVIPAPIPTTAPGANIASLSVQALGAGFLGAGFTRIAQRNRPVAVGQANAPRNGRPRRPPPRRVVGKFI
ncbi:MAG TPA: hypothetical protein VGP88_05180 [Thermoplasmata archaeon]|nr:hypothetical protein [Thermoplasmata archaeon]